MSEDLKRLRDAAALVRAIPSPETHPALAGFFGAVGDWLEDTASRAGYTARGVDLAHAHRVADAVIGSEPIPRGFRVGDVVQITGRGDLYDGKTGTITELGGSVSQAAGDVPEYSFGLDVDGFAGPVWCDSTEIRHLSAEEIARLESGVAR